MQGKQFKKRSAILDCLRATKAHPSADMVYAMLQKDHPDISLATVYRNLTLFKSQGIIQSLGTVDGAERFDAETEPHVHFICTACHTVQDLPQVNLPEDLCQEAEDQSGCQVASCSLSFTGLCRDCRCQ